MILFVPCLFDRFEKFSSECIIPLNINEFLFAHYMSYLRCKRYTLLYEKRAECASLL